MIDTVSTPAGANGDLKKTRHARAATTRPDTDRLPPHAPSASNEGEKMDMAGSYVAAQEEAYQDNMAAACGL